MKRKMTALLLAVLLLVGMTACGKTPTPAPESSDAVSDAPTDPDSTPVTEPTDTPDSEPTDEPTATTTAKEGDPTATTTKATTAKTTGGKAAKTTTAAKAKESTTKATTAGKVKRLSDAKVSDIGWGFYCLNFDKYGFDTKWRDLAQSDYVNTVFCNETKYLADLAECNVKVWYSVHDIYQKVVSDTAGWQDAFDEQYEKIKKTGHEDTVLGWYIDEPTNMAAVKALSKYAKEKYNKRFFICFMVQTTNPDVYGGFIDENSHLNKDNVQYLTDIAVDHYWDVTETNKKSYEALYAKLFEVMPKNCKVWYVPNTFASRTIASMSSSDIEEAAAVRIKHIDYMYDWLVNRTPKENQGGLLYFSYDFDSDYENLWGLYQINQNTKNGFKSVLAECIKLGRKICTGKM